MLCLDIKRVLFFSFVTFVLEVSCQTSCTGGWFGSRCEYKCRCANGSCDNNGLCTGSTCVGGWFGTACQYADLAYMSGSIAEITDGNDRTCMDPPGTDSVTLTLKSLVVFSWLRIYLNNFVNQTDVVDKLTLTFKRNSQPIECLKLVNVTVDEWTVDLHCYLPQTIDQVLLTGPIVVSLCSVYVSGGRNVALKEHAVQPSVYFETTHHTQDTKVSFPADKAVDGNTHQQFYEGYPCSHSASNGSWTLMLSQQRFVNRYAIYNRQDGNEHELIGFRLESFDSSNDSIFVYQDNTTQAQSVYTITHPHLPVQVIQVYSRGTWGIIALCEVEAYGDSICEAGKYGRECNQPCTCTPKEDCFASNGGCYSRCDFDFNRDGCVPLIHRGCAPEKFGPKCTRSCSEFCVKDTSLKSSCNASNGHCLRGCVDGYTGELCVTPGSSPMLNGTNIGAIVALLLLLVVVAAGLMAVYFLRRVKESTDIPKMISENPEQGGSDQNNPEESRSSESASQKESPSESAVDLPSEALPQGQEKQPKS